MNESDSNTITDISSFDLTSSRFNLYRNERLPKESDSDSRSISMNYSSSVSHDKSQLPSESYSNFISDPNIPSSIFHQHGKLPFNFNIQNSAFNQGSLHPPITSPYVKIPHINESNQLSIQTNENKEQQISFNINRSQSHAGTLSSMVQHENIDVNQLSNSFRNLTNNSSSSSSVILPNDAINQPRQVSCRNTPLDFPQSLKTVHHKDNLNGSSISLPPSNIIREPYEKCNKMSKFLQSSLETSKSFQSYKKQISSQSSPATRHNQQRSRSSVLNTDNLNPSRRMINIIEERVLIPRTGVAVPIPNISSTTKKPNCDPNIMRCTLNALPFNTNLLNKTRLPLAILLHPFRDLANLQVIESRCIVRCRISHCRAYINPFVSFIDQKRWKCNMCLRINELSEDAIYNKSTSEYIDILKRTEVRFPTVEYITPAEYSTKNVHIPIYVFIFDISFNATASLYQNTMGQILNTLKDLLERLPGYERAKVAFLGFDDSIHLYPLYSRGFREIVVSDIRDVTYVPLSTDLLIDLRLHRDSIVNLLTNLLNNVDHSHSQSISSSCLGNVLLMAKKLFGNSGGRITIFNASCPSFGEGHISPRFGIKSGNIFPITPDKEFYKTLSLEFAQAQIAVDLFQLGSVSCDLASLSIITRYCSGSLFYYPDLSCDLQSNKELNSKNIEMSLNETQRLLTDLQRYLTRKIGFEGILRIRSSTGFNILSSHGNFFARASDLFSMANVNPDSGIAIKLGIEDSSIDSNIVFFQAALLFISAKGERRIRIHTLCLPVSLQIDEIFRMADHQAVIAFLSKTLADRLQMSGNVEEAREALVCSLVDTSSAFSKFCLSSSLRYSSFPFPYHLRMLPLYVWGMLRSDCLNPDNENFDLTVSTLDSWRNMPLTCFIISIHPNLYDVTRVTDLVFPRSCKEVVDASASNNSEESLSESEDDIHASDLRSAAGDEHWLPEHLHLTIQSLSLSGAYLLDTSKSLILLIGSEVSPRFLKLILGTDSLSHIQNNELIELPHFHNVSSIQLRHFIRELQLERPLGSHLFVVYDGCSVLNSAFVSRLLEDGIGDVSYHRFLQQVHRKVVDN